MVTTRRRMPRFRLPSPVVLVTIIVLVAAYIVVGVLNNFADETGHTVTRALVLTSESVLHGEVWRLVTYGLLHDPANPLHLLFNCLMLYFFGRDVEQRLGKLRFSLFLLGALIAGGAAVVVAYELHIGTGVTLGFSAACEACTVMWALTNRNTPVLLFFAVPMKGIYMLWLAVAMWILDAVSASQISAAAHFGGILFGLAVYFATARRNRWRLFFDELLVKLRLRKGPRLTVVPKNDRWVN